LDNAGQGEPLWKTFIPLRSNSCNYLYVNVDKYFKKKEKKYVAGLSQRKYSMSGFSRWSQNPTSSILC